MSAGPSWYDLLGVDPTADTDEIRAAWRAQSADLDPTDRRFRSLSQAAEVLLDPQSRAAYDASLAEPASATAAPSPPPAVPVDLEKRTAADTAQAPEAATKARKAQAPEQPEEPVQKGPSRLPLVPAWLLLLVAVLTAVAIAGATVAAVRAGEPVSDEGGSFVEQSAEEARAAAVRAIVPVLSYDYRTLEEDAAAARSYMTSGYQEDKYDPLFAFVSENAPNTQTVVEVQVVDSAIVRTGKDRVEVLLFVDRPTTNRRNTEPIVYKDQATVTMARVDGQWLVDDLRTSPIQE